MPQRPVSAAVVGHVEWVQFARVEKVPAPGAVVHAREPFAEPAGGGAVAAVQLARLTGGALLFTTLGDDDLGRRSRSRLSELGVEVHAATRSSPTRQALTLLDDRGERTITTIGQRLEPSIEDSELPWERLAQIDAIYFTAGDAGALEAARRGRVLVASPRARSALSAQTTLDALVLSAEDEIERDAAQGREQQARLLVLTEGVRGGSYREQGGGHGRWRARATQALDAYGCGDSFAAGVTYALGGGMSPREAVELGARCGERCLTGRGPYERQLTAADL
ncbi:MAG: PfkB family carbohydrate kinase [Solirubrobacteraceae bacterium]